MRTAVKEMNMVEKGNVDLEMVEKGKLVLESDGVKKMMDEIKKNDIVMNDNVFDCGLGARAVGRGRGKIVQNRKMCMSVDSGVIV